MTEKEKNDEKIKKFLKERESDIETLKKDLEEFKILFLEWENTNNRIIDSINKLDMESLSEEDRKTINEWLADANEKEKESRELRMILFPEKNKK